MRLRTSLAVRLAAAVVPACALLAPGVAAPRASDIELRLLGTYATGEFGAGAAEIVAHDPKTQRLFVVNGADSTVDVLDASDPSHPSLLFSIPMAPYGDQANSVDVHHGVVAVAVQADVKTAPGKAVFFDTDGNFLNAVTVGALPDMITFSPDGRTVLTADEGEPNDDYDVDPLGTISVLDLKHGVERLTESDVTILDFAAYNDGALDPSVRIFGPNATVAQDLEPEYVAVSHDSKTAWVTLQENNAVAVVDIKARKLTSLVGLGFKDYSTAANRLDPSDRDGAISIANWPVFGMYQPDAIAAFRTGGRTYLITANEGDARDYDGFSEEARVGAITLDPVAFPTRATLRMNANLGRLNITTATGNTDGDAELEALYTFGARSFSIWSDTGELVFDSGDRLEQIVAATYPAFFNAGNDDNAFDSRSDNKGPEPEAIAVGELYGAVYAFVGLERVGGVMVYDVTDPTAPRFVEYVNNRDFTAAANTAAAGDLGPEGLHFVPREESPTNTPLLVVANEISGTTTVYEIVRVQR
jgi:2',3'-cyclic-nucleotide 2'-phosphodiesterase/3'-nucleotidase/5'-nucleotidase